MLNETTNESWMEVAARNVNLHVLQDDDLAIIFGQMEIGITSQRFGPCGIVGL